MAGTTSGGLSCSQCGAPTIQVFYFGHGGPSCRDCFNAAVAATAYGGWSQPAPALGDSHRVAELERSLAEAREKLAKVVEALAGLLADTQHKNHNCGNSADTCPVLAAREALAAAKGMSA